MWHSIGIQWTRFTIKIIKSGIPLDFNSLKRQDLMNLRNVPSLLAKLGGIEKLVQDGVIGEREIWDKEIYTESHVRSLLIKYAEKI